MQLARSPMVTKRDAPLRPHPVLPIAEASQHGVAREGMVREETPLQAWAQLEAASRETTTSLQVQQEQHQPSLQGHMSPRHPAYFRGMPLAPAPARGVPATPAVTATPAAQWRTVSCAPSPVPTSANVTFVCATGSASYRPQYVTRPATAAVRSSTVVCTSSRTGAALGSVKISPTVMNQPKVVSSQGSPLEVHGPMVQSPAQRHTSYSPSRRRYKHYMPSFDEGPRDVVLGEEVLHALRQQPGPGAGGSMKFTSEPGRSLGVRGGTVNFPCTPAAQGFRTENATNSLLGSVSSISTEGWTSRHEAPSTISTGTGTSNGAAQEVRKAVAKAIADLNSTVFSVDEETGESVERNMQDQVTIPRTPSSEGASTNFPRTGRPIALKVFCSHLESNHPLLLASFEGHKITSDWELDHVLQVTEMLTGVKRASQKLYHAGRELFRGCTIRGTIGVEEDQMPDRFTVHVIVDEERFPQRFGPLSIMEVPLHHEDFTMPKSTVGGFHWMMKNEVVESHGVRSPYDAQVTAQCSPTHNITLSEEERAEALIPAEAVEFAWSNPVVNWEQVEHDPHLLDNWASSVQDRSTVKDFLVSGGFVYLDKDRRIVKVTTATLNTQMGGGLQFGRKQRWLSCWTKALIGDGRFQRITTGVLKQAGAQFFCWLRPGEVLEDDYGKPVERQPDVPHGGFAFLFHEMCACSPQETVVDCYFPISGMSEQELDKGGVFYSLDHEDYSHELVGHTSAQLNHHHICALDG